MDNLIIIALVALLVGAAVFYIVKEKKKGKCVGCPASGCKGCRGGCCASASPDNGAVRDARTGG